MALVACSECKSEISSEAATCPKCGRKTPVKISGFRILALLAIALLLFGGCWVAGFGNL